MSPAAISFQLDQTLDRLINMKLLPKPAGAFWLPEMPSMNDIYNFDHTDLSCNPAYERYMSMHKVLVGNQGGIQLEALHRQLTGEKMPHYLVASGWAAAESALVQTDINTNVRIRLLDAAVQDWQRALKVQEYIEAHAPDNRIEYAYGQRIALDIAIAPLLRGMVNGDVRQDVANKVFVDCLNIAQLNNVHLSLMAKEENIDAVGAHLGLGYECNAMLALNRRLSNTWFAIPSMARSDSGYYYPRQTHDLLVIRQKHGALLDTIPVEIKAKPSLHDRNRYDALLVRGKMHLSVEGKYTPDHTLHAIAAAYEGTATPAERHIADSASNRFGDMIRDYYAGSVLGRAASRHSITVFHDSSEVIRKHPGLARSAA